MDEMFLKKLRSQLALAGIHPSKQTKAEKHAVQTPLMNVFQLLREKLDQVLPLFSEFFDCRVVESDGWFILFLSISTSSKWALFYFRLQTTPKSLIQLVYTQVVPRETDGIPEAATLIRDESETIGRPDFMAWTYFDIISQLIAKTLK